MLFLYFIALAIPAKKKTAAATVDPKTAAANAAAAAATAAKNGQIPVEARLAGTGTTTTPSSSVPAESSSTVTSTPIETAAILQTQPESSLQTIVVVPVQGQQDIGNPAAPDSAPTPSGLVDPNANPEEAGNKS